LHLHGKAHNSAKQAKPTGHQMSDRDDLAALRRRGADPDLLERIAASGLPGERLRRGLEATGAIDAVRRRFWPNTTLSAAEASRLKTIADLAADVLSLNGSTDAAERWWTMEIPWLGGRTPAATLARHDGPSIVEDLVNRIKYGIPS
jgi:uncharacterized protein (DUF2384 family)